MPRYKITVEYDGTPFAGWQQQKDATSVQQELVHAVTAFAGETVQVFGAGRTDAGVHATGQVAHIDLAKHWAPHTIRDAMNFHVKHVPICVLDCVEVSDEFDARFSAIQRHYTYVIVNRRPRLTLDRNRAWRVIPALDAARMQEAAQHLTGKHDFTTFRSVQCQARSPVKTVSKVQVRREAEKIIIDVSAPSFMHNQVRSFAGCLKFVGAGKWTSDDLKTARDALRRSACAPVAPAAGLYLTKVDYPADLDGINAGRDAVSASDTP